MFDVKSMNGSLCSRALAALLVFVCVDISLAQACQSTQYQLGANACQACPVGAVCNGTHLQGKVSGSTWVAGNSTCLLKSCPSGYRLSNSTYDNQECQPCSAAKYITRSDDPAFSCQSCPTAVNCTGGVWYGVKKLSTYDGWGYQLNSKLGYYSLVSCPNGSLIVNESADHSSWTCSQCPSSTYSINPEDYCDNNGVCKSRQCTICPAGAQCPGGSSFGTVNGSVWKSEVIMTSIGSSVQYRLVKCPAGYVLVRRVSPAYDECVLCPPGTYSLDVATFDPPFITTTSTIIAIPTDNNEFCLPCPAYATCSGSNVKPSELGWVRGQDVDCGTRTKAGVCRTVATMASAAAGMGFGFYRTAQTVFCLVLTLSLLIQ